MKKKTWTGLEVGGENKRFSKIYTKKENGVKNLKRKLIEGKKKNLDQTRIVSISDISHRRQWSMLKRR